MPAWLRQFASHFDLERTFTREGRQEITLRYAVWFSIVVLISLLPFRIIAWVSVRNDTNTFYLVNNIICISTLLLVGWINSRHKIKIASEIFIFISSYLCFTAYPYQNADQILLYLVIPVFHCQSHLGWPQVFGSDHFRYPNFSFSLSTGI